MIECCEAIVERFAPKYLKTPDSEEEWATVASLFEMRWNFPNVYGAIDGKRVITQQPIVILALIILITKVITASFYWLYSAQIMSVYGLTLRQTIDKREST